MKLGIDLETGHRWSLTSWASDQLPALGSFTLTGDPNGTGQLDILRRGNIHWTSGVWQNGQFENTNLQSAGPDVHLYYIFNETELSFTYLTRTYESLPALRMYPDGQLKGATLNLDVQCISMDAPTPGCVEYNLERLKCRKDYYIAPTYPYGYIYVNEYEYDERYNLTLHDCERICWRNCSCNAYTYATKNRAGCKTYHGQRIYNPAKAKKHTEYYPISYGQG
ncbi:hypothetical protein L6452_33978 [Arctium lappa]|uniref:Uncharacterized protein n=1 Tax=Arctium lappa TaxID=4217 RepID=A0ACB8YGX3_ARCLA|nr:hypothetical protein L6452_33978 [Arctium lappa]